MSESITATSNVIPFRSKELLLVDNYGHPFVPMKPVVEGMGLDWKTQYRKLQSGRFDSTMVMMTIVAEDGRLREMACMPLRKLAGWLMSIHASKVRPDLRDNVIAYQNECDDVLWSYWNDGIAVRNDNRTAASVLGTTIGTDGFHCLAAVLDGKLRGFKGGAKRAAKNHVWQQVHRAFSVVRAEDIPADKLDSVRCFIAAYDVREGDFIEAEKPSKEQRPEILSHGQRVLGYLDPEGVERWKDIPQNASVLTYEQFIDGLLVNCDIPVTTDEMFRFAQLAMNNLQRRSQVCNAQLRAARGR